jgi:hypothetical protein
MATGSDDGENFFWEKREAGEENAVGTCIPVMGRGGDRAVTASKPSQAWKQW